MTDESIKKGVLRELIEESVHVLNACKFYIRMTDAETPGRSQVLKQIEDFDKKLTIEFTPENIGN